MLTASRRFIDFFYLTLHKTTLYPKTYFKTKRAMQNSLCVIVIAVPAGGAGRAIAPPSFEDLGKIKIFREVRKKCLGKTIIFRAARRKIWAKSRNLER